MAGTKKYCTYESRWQRTLETLIPMNWTSEKQKEWYGSSEQAKLQWPAPFLDYPEWVRMALTINIGPPLVAAGSLYGFAYWKIKHFAHIGEIEKAFQSAKYGENFKLPTVDSFSYCEPYKDSFGYCGSPGLFPWTNAKYSPPSSHSYSRLIGPVDTNPSFLEWVKTKPILKESLPTGYSPFLEWFQSKYAPTVDHLTSSFEKSFNNFISSPPLDSHGFTPDYGLKLFDPESKLRLSSYGSLAPVDSFGSGGLPSIIGTPALHQAFENHSKIQEMQRNMRQTSNFQNPPDVKLFDFNSRANLGLTSFHNQWNVSPFSDANQSPLFTDSTTPRSGLGSRSSYDTAPSFHTQFRLSTPTSLTSHTLGGSQLGFNPFAGSGLGGLGGASNIGSPLFNNWSMYNPSQNLSTLGSGVNPAPFGGVGAGFSR